MIPGYCAPFTTMRLRRVIVAVHEQPPAARALSAIRNSKRAVDEPRFIGRARQRPRWAGRGKPLRHLSAILAQQLRRGRRAAELARRPAPPAHLDAAPAPAGHPRTGRSGSHRPASRPLEITARRTPDPRATAGRARDVGWHGRCGTGGRAERTRGQARHLQNTDATSSLARKAQSMTDVGCVAAEHRGSSAGKLRPSARGRLDGAAAGRRSFGAAKTSPLISATRASVFRAL